MKMKYNINFKTAFRREYLWIGLKEETSQSALTYHYLKN